MRDIKQTVNIDHVAIDVATHAIYATAIMEESSGKVDTESVITDIKDHVGIDAREAFDTAICERLIAAKKKEALVNVDNKDEKESQMDTTIKNI